ncbi:MAG: glutathione S-transferase N-terminal domain-containing protein [Planktomarina sp.]|nr:glutathione S-transferase N-terminal domain-containing protein [Planktomarina sp.]
MILWGRPSSVNVQKVLWALEELGLPYEHRIVAGKYGGLDAPEFKALTPAPRVPVLQNGSEVIWESNAILRYLAPKIVPTQVDIWMEFSSTTFQPSFIGMFWQRVRIVAEEQDGAVLATHLKGLKSGLTIIESGMADGRSYIAGSEFSMADVAIGSLFYRIMDLYPDFLVQYPRVMTWHKNISIRTGYSRWVATPYDDLRVT